MALATRSKPKASTRKRQANHHRKNKRYLKSYSPYIPLLAVVGLGLLINSTWAHTAVLGSKSDFSTTSLLIATNKPRFSQHESGLTIDPQLSAAAQAKANDMVTHNYWSHNAPDGQTPWSFITAAGYSYQTAGENLAYGFESAPDAVAGWMNSPEHRANILDTGYQNVGFGVASSPNYQGKGPQTVVVAEYGQPAGAVANISFSVNNPTNKPVVKADSTELAAHPVSRVQVLTGGQATWSLLLLAGVAGAAITLFVIRHGLRIRKLFTKGEYFIAHHIWVDVLIVFIGTGSLLLTQTSGIIR